MSTFSIFGVEITAELGAVTAAIAAIAGGWVGLYQYIKAERWKRADFAIKQVRRAWNDDTLAFCCCAIDWGVGPIVIPLKHRPLFASGVTTIEHNWTLMAKALRPQLHKSWFDQSTRAQFLLYRRAFDEFFAYLDGLAIFRDYGLVRETELSPLATYIRQLHRPLYWPTQSQDEVPEVSADNLFCDFIRAFYPERVLPWVQGS